MPQILPLGLAPYTLTTEPETIQQALTNALSALDSCKPIFVVLYTASNVQNGDEFRCADKVRRVTERLRRVAVKVLEDKDSVVSLNRSLRQLVQALVEQGVNLVKSTIHTVRLSSVANNL